MKRHFDDILLGSIELFCLAAEAGSFTAAALAAGVTPAAVSRSISRLEKRLGVRLFVRSTRSIRLTDGGRHYFEQCRHALSQLVDAEVAHDRIQPRREAGLVLEVRGALHHAHEDFHDPQAIHASSVNGISLITIQPLL